MQKARPTSPIVECYDCAADYAKDQGKCPNCGSARYRTKRQKGERKHQHRRKPITRQKLKRMDDNEIYLGMRDVYLQENPVCVRCPNRAIEVHHVIRGVNRSKSLLNPDTWLGVCSACHDRVERLPWRKQMQLKQRKIEETMLRLRK